MTPNKSSFETLYKSMFPRVCKACGHIYKNYDDLKERSFSKAPAGFKTYSAWLFGRSEDEVDKNIVAGFWDCRCGSTLTFVGEDRRHDDSLDRQLFERIMLALAGLGVEQDDARDRLKFFFDRIDSEKMDRALLEKVIGRLLVDETGSDT